MKKYVKLTTLEAFRYFLDHDESLVPETATEVRKKKENEFAGEYGVTVIVPTHRTHPDSDRDPVELKNGIAEAEKQLYGLLEKRDVWPILENMKLAEISVDHRHNLDSLVLYANEKFSAVVKIPVELGVHVFVGEQFDLRPLYKARQQNRNYYILSVSKQVIRLIEAFNDRALYEREEGDFPFARNRFYEVHPKKVSADVFVRNMEKEFYNDADKSFQKYWNENPVPVVLAGDVKSVAYYQEVMDYGYMVMGQVPGSFDQSPLHVITEAAYPVVEHYRKEKQKEHIKAIENGEDAGMLTSQLVEMFDIAGEGRAEALYLEWDFSPEGRIKWQDVGRFNNESQQTELSATDLLSVLITDVARQGGRIIFLENGSLEMYGGVVLLRRF